MKTSKVLRIVAVILVLLLAAALVGGGAYLRSEARKDTFFANTSVNGYDVSGLTVQQGLDLLASDYSDSDIVVREDGKDAISGRLADFGYVVDQEKLLAGLNGCLEQQRDGFMALVGSLMNGNSFTVTLPFTFYEERFNAAVNAAALPEARFSSVNAKMMYNEAEKNYYIEPEVYGNEFVDSQLQDYVRGQIDDFVNGNRPGDTLTIDFPENLYIVPEITSGDVTMNTTVNVYNQFCKAEITHVFGSEKISIDWDTIKDWIYIENGEGYIDDEKAYAYVNEIAAKYNTRHYDRTFHTSLGTDIVIPSSENDYGYTVNEDEEFSRLIADIRGNAPVEREPVYYSANDYGNPVYYKREGTDDLAGTYVEVNLTTQHLWFYKDYSLIVDCDIVSGSVAKKAETKTGTFALAYKESPSILRGSNAADGYETKVTYWMPFYEGQGLHDASWRTAFGGNIYMTNGSHGCVNMPPYAAQLVYENIDHGVAIIIYK